MPPPGIDTMRYTYHTPPRTKIMSNDTHDDTPFTKYDGDKPQLDLLPPRALEETGRVLTYGAKKYSPDNWKKVDDTRRYVAATLRHVFAYMRGERNDPETGFHHLGHAVCCLLFMVELDLLEESHDQQQ